MKNIMLNRERADQWIGIKSILHPEQAVRKHWSHGRPVGPFVTVGAPRKNPVSDKGLIYFFQRAAAYVALRFDQP